MDKIYTEDDVNLFRHPSRIMIAGFTNSGKTSLCTRLVEKYHKTFSKIVISGVKTHPLQNNNEIREKLLLSEDIVNLLDDDSPYNNPNESTLHILDDNFLIAANSETVVNSFTRGRHANLSVIFITQNLFFPGRHARSMHLNTSHYILMKSRDLFQIECLARQIYGKGIAKKFVEVYKTLVVRNSYGYLLVDLAAGTPEPLQLRSNIVNEEPCERVHII